MTDRKGSYVITATVTRKVTVDLDDEEAMAGYPNAKTIEDCMAEDIASHQDDPFIFFDGGLEDDSVVFKAERVADDEEKLNIKPIGNEW